MKTATFILLAAAALTLGMGASDALAQDDAGAGQLSASPPQLPVGTVARYRVTFFKSTTTTAALRTASIVSATNANLTGGPSCTVAVDWRTGGTSNACSTNIVIAPGATLDFCSRTIPTGITTCNSTCSPSLTFNEGSAVIGSSTTTGCEKIALSARTVYTSSTTDSPVSAITDAKIVRWGFGNSGD